MEHFLLMTSVGHVTHWKPHIMFFKEKIFIWIVAYLYKKYVLIFSYAYILHV